MKTTLRLRVQVAGAHLHHIVGICSELKHRRIKLARAFFKVKFMWKLNVRCWSDRISHFIWFMQVQCLRVEMLNQYKLYDRRAQYNVDLSLFISVYKLQIVSIRHDRDCRYCSVNIVTLYTIIIATIPDNFLGLNHYGSGYKATCTLWPTSVHIEIKMILYFVQFRNVPWFPYDSSFCRSLVWSLGQEPYSDVWIDCASCHRQWLSFRKWCSFWWYTRCIKRP
jgi:hypothetical protein